MSTRVRERQLIAAAYPDELLASEGATAPAAGYEQRESLEPAFVVALQHVTSRGVEAPGLSSLLEDGFFRALRAV